MGGPSPYFAPNADGSPWYLRVFRLRNWRVFTQLFFFSLFIFLLWATWFSRLGGYPVSLFLEVDPLVAIATAISTHTVYRWLWRALWVLIPTLLLGRVFCGWICPLGTLQQFTAWLFNIRKNKPRLDSNRYRPLFQLKYLLLAGVLILAAFGSLQVGLLDPICLLTRSIATAIQPAIDSSLPHGLALLHSAPGATEQRVFDGSFMIGALLLALLGMTLITPRFFCRVLCPLGGLLGLLSRFSMWRIDRDLHKCTDCDLCLRSCEGASDPQAALRKSECFVCFNCIDDCPEDALSFSLVPLLAKTQAETRKAAAAAGGDPVELMPRKSKIVETEKLGPDVPRRRWILAGAMGLLAYPFVRLSNAVTKRGYHPKAIRPPGSVEESEFLERCIKCDQCINVCPTNVLQPAPLDIGGIEGIWSPVLNFRVGFCQYNCTLCSEVCPTGAIQKISSERKLGVKAFEKAGPIRLGTAFYDRGRCLPWAMETPCVVCEEVCPTSPKAIGSYEEKVRQGDGTVITLKKPYIRPDVCIGCGICEHECPVTDSPAVYVTAVGESRSKERSLLLKSTRGRP